MFAIVATQCVDVLELMELHLEQGDKERETEMIYIISDKNKQTNKKSTKGNKARGSE